VWDKVPTALFSCEIFMERSMKIQIQSRTPALANSVRAHLARRLHFRLDRFALRIVKIAVQIAESDFREGAHEKRCRIHVRLRPRGTSSAEYASENLYVAFDCAAAFVERDVIDAIRRIRSFGRHKERFQMASIDQSSF
jgi:ribosome-associated translation inhibitor RaiA